MKSGAAQSLSQGQPGRGGGRLRWRGRRGNALLETALVLPVLLYLAFGMVEFGHFFYVKHNLQAAARDGVRVAAMPSCTDADVTAAVASTMTLAGLQNSGYTVTLNPTNMSGAAIGSTVSVTVQCTWQNVGVRPMRLISGSKAVRSVASMRKEG